MGENVFKKEVFISGKGTFLKRMFLLKKEVFTQKRGTKIKRGFFPRQKKGVLPQEKRHLPPGNGELFFKNEYSLLKRDNYLKKKSPFRKK